MSIFRYIATACVFGTLSVSNIVLADEEKRLEALKLAVGSYPEVQYSMMGDVVYLHGTTDAIPELNNIIKKLMAIDGISEVRSNIFKK